MKMIFLVPIISYDETWISHIIPECKKDSIHWKHFNSPHIRKFKIVPLLKKVLASVFWDRKGVIHAEYSSYGNIINAENYCETLKELKRSI